MIIIAGATGDLGLRIAKELRAQKTQVRALVRKNTRPDKIQHLESIGIEVLMVDYADPKALSDACAGGGVLISTLAGLRESMIVTQTQLLNAAASAKVPRFIPSDFALDFTKLPPEWNRNLNFRNEFRQIADNSNLQVTSILNGGFMNMLTGQAPFILFNMNRILCWGDPDQLTDWTTIEDTAKYTAMAAMDAGTPRFLKIAGDQVSANSLATLMTELTGRPFKIFRPGNLNVFMSLIKLIKFFHAGNDELYPPWQGMQYMHNMCSGIAKFDKIDNNRYSMNWTTAKDLLSKHLQSKSN